MKAHLFLSVVAIALLCGPISAQEGNATVYVVHGIQGGDLGLDSALPVDVAVEGDCLLQGFTYGQIAGPLSLAPGSYNVKIGLADAENPCSGDPVIEADVPFEAGEVAVVIAHLAADGSPTAAKFLLDMSSTEEGRSRITLHHTAAAPAVDIKLRGTVCDWQGDRIFEGVPNGGQGALTVPPGKWDVSLLPAGSSTPVLGPQPLTIDSSQAYVVFAVGSLDGDSLTLLVYEGALQADAPLSLVPAVVYVIHGIPGQDLGLPAELPVDIALNGACALTGFTFGTITDPIELVPGPYHVAIGVANADSPCSEPPVIEADVKLAAQDNVTVIAYLTEHAAPTAGVFPNALEECYKPLDSPLIVHHTAAAPAVDVRAETKVGSIASALSLHNVTNGDQKVLTTWPGTWNVSISPAGQAHPVFGPVPLTLGGEKAYFLYAVGSLTNDTFTVLQNVIPLAPSIVDTVVAANKTGPFAGEFDTLIAAIVAADPLILETLSGEGEFTVLGPTDAAFAALEITPQNVGELDQAFLTDVLLYHVALGRLLAADVLASEQIEMLVGGSLLQDAGVLTDNVGRQANITATDIEAWNGVIHVIDAVVLPKAPPEPLPNLLDLAVQLNSEGDYAGVFDTLIAAVLAADPSIAEALSGDDPLTVFAPTDDAFAALELTADNIGGLDQSFLTDVLLYHVTGGKLLAADVLAAEQIEMLKGGSLLQDAGVLTDNLGRQATIIVTDVEASNGVIHVIDAVVLPKAPPEPLPNLLDLAVQLNSEGDYAGVFDTLIAAVLAADPSIAEALSGEDPLTVFAPTDDAFAALELTADNIGGLDQSFLTDVLLYHVTGGKLLAADVLAAEQIEMLKGGSLTQDAGVLTDNLGGTATIIVTDVEASNGVIHAIDAVVLPKAPPGS